MALNFPNNPSNGQTYEGFTYNSSKGVWNPSAATGAGGPTAGIFYENDQHVTSDYTITTDKNAMSAGPITIDSGVVVTVPTGSEWTIV